MDARITKARAVAKIEERIAYLLRHCDSDTEYATVEWVASHLAAEFGVSGLTFTDGKFIQAA